MYLYYYAGTAEGRGAGRNNLMGIVGLRSQGQYLAA